jgi:hypothetical protein
MSYSSPKTALPQKNGGRLSLLARLAVHLLGYWLTYGSFLSSSGLLLDLPGETYFAT